MKKILALLLAMIMVFALCACGGGDKADDTADSAADAAAPAADGDLDAYKTYVLAYAKAGAPSDEDAASVEAAVNACATAEEVEAVSELTVLFENAGLLTYADWVAAGCPEADVSDMTMGDPNAGAPTGEPPEGSGEPTGEPPADAPAAE